MRIHLFSSIFLLVSSSSLLPTFVSSLGFDCEHVVADGVKYNLAPLGGVHSVYHVNETENAVVNTTYVLNICNTLKGASIRGDLKCGTSKNVCGFQYTKSLDNSQIVGKAFPIVGFDHPGHGVKDPEITRLKKVDSGSEGLLIKMYGGELLDTDTGLGSGTGTGNNSDERAAAAATAGEGGNNKNKNSVGAMIEFKCDPTRSGLEGLGSGDVSDEEERSEEQQQQQQEQYQQSADNNNNNGDDRSLQFRSFGPVDDNFYLLKLDWKTRYACDNYLKDKKDGQSSSGGMGFFSWMIIILFLCIAAYLIFGSWLNYNRYGARGWDLLPHGDTIRDIPYIFQDWLKKIVNSLQGAGTGTRGGYSAV